MKKKRVKYNLGQTSAEYFLIAVVILAAILGANFLGKSHDAIDNFFVKASEKMTNSTVSPTPTPTTCPEIVAEYDSLGTEIGNLMDQAANADATADSSEASIPEIQSAIAIARSYGDQHTAAADNWANNWAKPEEDAAAADRKKIDDGDKYYSDNNCSSYETYYPGINPAEGCSYGTPICDCYDIYTARPGLIADEQAHKDQAAIYRGYEASERATAKEYYDAANEAETQIANMQQTIADLRANAVSLRAQATSKTTEKDQLKTDHPDCFS